MKILIVLLSIFVLANCEEWEYFGRSTTDTPFDLYEQGGGNELPFALPDLQEKMHQFIMKCSMNMGGAVPDFIEPAINNLTQCTMAVTGGEPTQIRDEMMRTFGNTDQVGDFIKIKCKKRSTAFRCIDKFFKALNPCYTDEENEIKESLSRQFKRIIAFVCNEEGNYIQQFLDNDGPQCMTTKQNDLLFCMQPLITKYSDFDFLDVNNWYNSEQCSDSHDFISCIRDTLGDCDNPLPNEIVNNFLVQVLNESPCRL